MVTDRTEPAPGGGPVATSPQHHAQVRAHERAVEAIADQLDPSFQRQNGNYETARAVLAILQANPEVLRALAPGGGRDVASPRDDATAELGRRRAARPARAAVERALAMQAGSVLAREVEQLRALVDLSELERAQQVRELWDVLGHEAPDPPLEGDPELPMLWAALISEVADLRARVAELESIEQRARELKRRLPIEWTTPFERGQAAALRYALTGERS